MIKPQDGLDYLEFITAESQEYCSLLDRNGTKQSIKPKISLTGGKRLIVGILLSLTEYGDVYRH